MGASGTPQPCSRLTRNMWTALVLICISCLSLSESRVASQDPRHLGLNQTLDNSIKESASKETTESVLSKTSGNRTLTTPSPVTLAERTSEGDPSSPTVIAGRTHRTDVAPSATSEGDPSSPTVIAGRTHRTDVAPSATSEGDPSSPTVIAGRTHRTDVAPSATSEGDRSSPAVTGGRTHVGPSVTAAGPPDHRASGVPMPPAPTSAPPAPSPMAALSTASTRAPSSRMLPTAAPLTTPATSAQTAAVTRANASSPAGAQSPSTHTHSPAPPTTPTLLNVSTRGPTIQASAASPVADTPGRPTPRHENTSPESTPPSVAPMSTPVVTTTTAQAERPAATTVPAPVPHASPNPGVEATSPAAQPSPAPASQGPTGPPEQVQPEATGGSASTRPTSGSSGDSEMPTTHSCQLSTQSQYLVVTTKPLSLSSVNKSSLLAVLLLGVTLFFTVLVLLALQAHESYKRKDYTQVDYLINGMYADSEM